ncbi:hypothetical protein JQN58_19900 [Aneurinibacillus sp. BA2021]|nr:hypothetical protein [Aneurinibacillus sp. BA2021]
MKKKKLITFYAVLFLIGVNAVLWTYMWQEFQRTQLIPSATGAKHSSPHSEVVQHAKPQEEPRAKETKREAVAAPIAHTEANSTQTSTEMPALPDEAERLLSYEQELQRLVFDEGRRDKYVSLVEDQILNGQRGNKIDYTVLKEAGTVFRTISNQLDALAVPEDLSPQSKTTARQAKLSFSQAYWHKADAMALLANYLDTGEAEWKGKYERKIAKSEAYIQDGIEALRVQETRLHIPASASFFPEKQ